MKTRLISLLTILICAIHTPSYAGIDFAMSSERPEIPAIPDFKSNAEAIEFAKKYSGMLELAWEFRRIIDENSQKISEILEYPSDVPIEYKLQRMEKASKVSKINQYYRLALKIIDGSNVGSVVVCSSEVVR
jgi:hypothetical protein